MPTSKASKNASQFERRSEGYVQKISEFDDSGVVVNLGRANQNSTFLWDVTRLQSVEVTDDLYFSTYSQWVLLLGVELSFISILFLWKCMNLGFLTFESHIIDKLIKTELFSGINSIVCCLFERRHLLILSFAANLLQFFPALFNTWRKMRYMQTMQLFLINLYLKTET